MPDAITPDPKPVAGVLRRAGPTRWLFVVVDWASNHRDRDRVPDEAIRCERPTQLDRPLDAAATRRSHRYDDDAATPLPHGRPPLRPADDDSLKGDTVFFDADGRVIGVT